MWFCSGWCFFESLLVLFNQTVAMGLTRYRGGAWAFCWLLAAAAVAAAGERGDFV